MNRSLSLVILLITTNIFSGGVDKITVGIQIRTAAACLAQLKKHGLLRDFALPDCFEPQKALPAPPLRRALTRTGSTQVKPKKRNNNAQTDKELEDAWRLDPLLFRKKDL